MFLFPFFSVTLRDPTQETVQREILSNGWKSMVACNKAFTQKALQMFAQMQKHHEGT
jgi:hypothetical protein